MNYLKNPLYLYIAIGFLLVTNIVTMAYLFLKENECPICENENIIEMSKFSEDEEEKMYINVDIKGYVKKPGVYQLEKGAIINDLIKLAGGVKSSGTTENINLSKKLVDEDMIVVNSKSELKKMNSCEPTNSISTANNNAISKTEQSSNKISINTATKEELMTLSGVGEKTAEKILEYRNNQKFNSIDDLKNVSGIGDSTFEKIKDLITI